MDQTMQHCETAGLIAPMMFHEGRHDILEGIEDMDDIFGLHEEETNQARDELKKTRKTSEPGRKKEKADTKEQSQLL